LQITTQRLGAAAGFSHDIFNPHFRPPLRQTASYLLAFSLNYASLTASPEYLCDAFFFTNQCEDMFPMFFINMNNHTLIQLFACKIVTFFGS
jgi:hypothetical protein